MATKIDTNGIFNPFDKSIRHIYGPYIYKDTNGSKYRRRIYIVFEDSTKFSMAYARWLMSQHLQERIADTVEVDHMNEDPLDDRIENYQLLTSSDNAKKSQLGKQSPLKGIEKGWKHGTIYGWMKKKCDCGECTIAKRCWYDERNAKRNKRVSG